jgi:hypothetical protein
MSTAELTDRLLPQRVDNTYRGHNLALWLFGAVVLMKLAMSLNSIFNGYVVASSADGSPLTHSPPPLHGRSLHSSPSGGSPIS